jgi:hypothetical protein
MLDYKMVFGIADCKFWVKKISPHFYFEEINKNFVKYLNTAQFSIENELEDF